jgi:hypothetical protein
MTPDEITGQRWQCDGGDVFQQLLNCGGRPWRGPDRNWCARKTVQASNEEPTANIILLFARHTTVNLTYNLLALHRNLTSSNCSRPSN